jgi:hypothetical protein
MANYVAKYVKHGQSDDPIYKMETSEFLKANGKTHREAYKDAVAAAYELFLEVYPSPRAFHEMLKLGSFQTISRMLFTDAEMSNAYEDVVDDVAQIIANGCLHPLLEFEEHCEE